MSTNGIAKRRPGRPSLLTPERKARIVAAVKCGMSCKAACAATGIASSTFYLWQQKGGDPDAPPEYSEFLEELTQAKEEGQAARVALIQRAGQKDWRALAWLLERTDPEQWSLRYQIEHSVQQPQTVADFFSQLRTRREEAALENVALPSGSGTVLEGRPVPSEEDG